MSCSSLSHALAVGLAQVRCICLALAKNRAPRDASVATSGEPCVYAPRARSRVHVSQRGPPSPRLERASSAHGSPLNVEPEPHTSCIICRFTRSAVPLCGPLAQTPRCNLTPPLTESGGVEKRHGRAYEQVAVYSNRPYMRGNIDKARRPHFQTLQSRRVLLTGTPRPRCARVADAGGELWRSALLRRGAQPAHGADGVRLRGGERASPLSRLCSLSRSSLLPLCSLSTLLPLSLLTVPAVQVFVNDDCSAETLHVLKDLGVQMVTLRCVVAYPDAFGRGRRVSRWRIAAL
jgi:hypothetical protein